MTARVLWTTVPEVLSVRRPTAIFTDLSRDVGRRLLELHPHLLGADRSGGLGSDLGGVQLFNFAPDQPAGGFAFQDPGEGAWSVFPRVELRVTKAAAARVAARAATDPVAASVLRIDMVVSAAAELASALELRGTPVVWQLTDNGSASGLLGIGAAKVLGSAVVVSTGKPDALSLAVMRRHGVELEAVYNAGDALRVQARVRGASA